MKYNTAYLSLGSNIGNRREHLNKATKELSKQTNIIKKSPVVESEALVIPGSEPQPLYLNQVVQVQTKLNAGDLLRFCRHIETRLRRTREKKWAPRTIDIDILIFNSQELASETLTIPHSHLHERRFVLRPLADIAPHLKHPILQKTIAELLAECKDTLAVKRYHETTQRTVESEKRIEDPAESSEPVKRDRS